MKRVFSDNSQSIGNTPLVRLNRVTAGAKAKSWPRSRDETPPTP